MRVAKPGWLAARWTNRLAGAGRPFASTAELGSIPDGSVMGLNLAPNTLGLALFFQKPVGNFGIAGFVGARKFQIGAMIPQHREGSWLV